MLNVELINYEFLKFVQVIFKILMGSVSNVVRIILICLSGNIADLGYLKPSKNAYWHWYLIETVLSLLQCFY